MTANKDGRAAFHVAADLLKIYLARNTCPANKVPQLLVELHEVAMVLLGEGQPSEGRAGVRSAVVDSRDWGPRADIAPAVPVEQSIADDHLICLEDGKSCKLLSKYIAKYYGLSEEQYRRRWGLPPDYPMVAPALSRKRASLAQKIQPHLARKKFDRTPTGHARSSLDISAYGSSLALCGEREDAEVTHNEF